MLTIEDLGYHYPGAAQPALSGVSLQVRRGEVFGLLGPNGAGKTTLLSHLAGTTRPQQGRILFDGEVLAGVRRHGPTRIALAPQEFAFYPMLSVGENLHCFAGACGLAGKPARQAIDRCLAFVQLEACRHTRADCLSGGMKRRLNLAVALLASPEMILLDEPTAGVDPQSRAFLLDSVKALAAEGVAVIYTSHYMEEIEAIADRLAILDHGRVLCCGTLDELLHQEDCHRLDLVVAPAHVPAVAACLAGFGTVAWHGTHASLELPAGRSPLAVLGALEAACLPVEHVTYGRSTLEHLFMQLTHRSLRDA